MAFAQKTFSQNGDALDVKLDDLLAEEILIQVTGAGTLTLVARVSMDGVNYVDVQLQPIGGGAAVSTITAAGMLKPAFTPYGARYFRLVCTAFTSGTLVGLVQNVATARG